ncbi:MULTISPECIES: bifunctional diguanylate cyclase/phosphodiesterase [unclassified Beijerinckia]|uniref:putative bifunctional diguanylate cyclase/phosphodiesterase n=1 Tax=unclassified Beijerinckia TaxID=2638183 RepID=UPI000894A12F|nr:MULTISPECIES: bifunctional diguanylate cyclase/phosphodiesterase [unclassified Beijerinckia]MDH7799697.1 diguanylate cyclase (GGDEF)-like protein [Beijerinckia sp. GAS462]SEB49648.1 diguanylate cyclase/phosphodiesterase [Beijerinckia sp. 28-YEA-48]
MNERPANHPRQNDNEIKAFAPNPIDILNSIGAVVYTWDIASDQITWGPNAEQVLGIPATEVDSGAAFHDLLAMDSRTSRFDSVIHSAENDAGGGVAFSIQYGLRINPLSGERAATTWFDDTGRWFTNELGRPALVHGVIRNLSALGLATPADQTAHFDPLAGTLNRTRLADHITRQLENARRRQSTFGFLLLAIDDLAEINRRHSFDIGDELLANLGQRLRGQMRITDTVSRYAGNRFAMLLECCDHAKLIAAAERIERIIAESPFATSAGRLPCKIRMGGVVAPVDARNAQAVFQNAEEALSVAKTRVAERFVKYEPSLAQNDQRRRAQFMADTIVEALNDRRITIAMQPIVSRATGEPALYEALLRLRLEGGEVLSPANIFPIAEKNELVQLLDRRVLELALVRMSADPSLHVSVNMSGKTVHDIRWVDDVAALLRLHPGCAERLVVEFTETCAIEDIEMTARVIGAIKALGVKVAMDDFGAGHTSFRNLRRLDIDMLKIDGAFIQNLTRSADDRFFVRTLIELARHLSIPVVAEWVEDKDTADLLSEWQVDYFQGDYFGRAEEQPAGNDAGAAKISAA